MAISIFNLLAAIRAADNYENATSARRIYDAVTALIEAAAPEAPDAIKDQAAVQAVGYIWEAPASAPARQNFANAMQNSGANALLAPWREHGAGVI